MKPDWSKAPEWANYWAQDADGRCRWHAQKPVQWEQRWDSNMEFSDITVCPDWMNSFQQRPVDPYAKLKKAAADPSKEIRFYLGGGAWDEWDGDEHGWGWVLPPDQYEIRDKPVVKTAYRRPYMWVNQCPCFATSKDADSPKLSNSLDLPWIGPVEEFTYEVIP